MEERKRFDLSIDHPMLEQAKAGFNACMKAMVDRAISTGSMEGTVTLKIRFDITEEADRETGEFEKRPEIQYKAQFAVPIKEGCEAKIVEKSRLEPNPSGGWLMINDQVTIDELMKGE